MACYWYLSRWAIGDEDAAAASAAADDDDDL